MNVNFTVAFKVLGKLEPIVSRDGNQTFYKIMVMQSDDCGAIFVTKSIYDGVEVGQDVLLRGLTNTVFENGKAFSKLSYKELLKTK